MSYLFSALSPNFAQNQRDMLAREGREYTPEDPGITGGLMDLEVPLNAVTRGLEAEPAIALSLAASNVPHAVDKVLGTDYESWWHKNITNEAVAFRDSLKVNPVTHGAASQVLDSVFGLIPQAALTKGLGTAALSGIAETADHIHQGKPLDVAAKLGAITGITNAAGIALPAAAPVLESLGPALAQRLATGAIGNMAMGAGADYARHEVLSDAGFHAQAEQYRWNDLQGRAVDGVLGAAFGGLAHVQALVKPSDVDAALTLNESRKIDDAAPGIPTTPEAANAHLDAFNKAVDDLSRGDEVTSRVDAEAFLHDPIRQQRTDALESHIAGEQFAERTGRRYEDNPTYADGTAHLLPQVLDFYDQHVAILPKGDTTPMPDAIFRIGEVSDNVAAGLHDFLPGFNDGLREARISAQSIKHIHDSRPSIAKQVLEDLERGVLQADEVLPNPKNPDRALLVLKNVDSGSPKTKHGVSVLEVSANGKGIDVVSAMTSPDKYLKSARELAKSRVDDLVGGAAVPSSSLSADLHQQHHPAADFPKLNQAAETSIDHPVTESRKIEPPGIAIARQIIERDGDIEIPHIDDAGNEMMLSLKQLLDDADRELADGEKMDAATQAAITCFLKFGDDV